jgi:hypothetical protein
MRWEFQREGCAVVRQYVVQVPRAAQLLEAYAQRVCHGEDGTHIAYIPSDDSLVSTRF